MKKSLIVLSSMLMLLSACVSTEAEDTSRDFSNVPDVEYGSLLCLTGNFASQASDLEKSVI